jgi:DNA primase
MPTGFSPHLLDEIRTRVDIVELVGQWVNLKRAGVNWKGLCPFHAEKTPSFTVHPKKGIFHCFGCGAGGDAFGFLMRQDRLAFPEAVRALAQRVGVELPTERRTETEGKLDGIRQVMARAAEFYTGQLWQREGEKARGYLEGRGIDPDVARRFGLGWAPEGWDHLLGLMKAEGVSDEILAQAGLVVPRQTGPGFYDRFRGRLLFPIRDPQGRVIAFGGRALGREEPKYLNSPETPLYVKGQTLYALDMARTAMRETNRAIIVEGYVDCLMAHQHGFVDTVAALGTAFTPAQLALLHRYAEEVVTVFDADAAGRKASARAEEMMQELMNLRDLGWSVAQTGSFQKSDYFPLKVAVLPAGHDPDSLLRAEGADAFRSRLDQARSILSFVMAQALEEEDLTTERGRARAHARVSLLLSKVGNAEEATGLARQAARQLAIDPTQLWIEARQLQGARARQTRPERARTAEPARSETGWPPPNLADRDVLALLLRVDEARARLLPFLEDEDMPHAGLRALLAALRRAPESPAETLMSELPGEAERGLLASLLVEDREWSDVGAQVNELERRFEIRRRKRRIRQVTQAIVDAQAAGDPALAPLEAELEHLQREAQAVRDLSVARAASPPDPFSPER